jgi:chromosome segregation ATPase
MRQGYWKLERKADSEISNMELTADQLLYIYDRLANHYDLSQELDWGDGRMRVLGRAGTQRITLHKKARLRTLIHEVAHVLDYVKNPTKKVRHCKRHLALMRRIWRFTEPRLQTWLEAEKRREERERATLQRQFERRQQLEAYRKSPRYKLDKLTEKQQVLLGKIARCQRRLKKVQRGIKIWEKKVKQVDTRTETGQDGIQTLEGEPGLMRTK